MMFRTMLESPDIKLTIFPKSAPALGLSAFAALPFSSSFWAFGFIYESVDEKKGKQMLERTYFHCFTTFTTLSFLITAEKSFRLRALL